MDNVICRKLKIDYPILQGPMAWASDSHLSASVSEEGGLGIMGIGFAPEEIFKNEIQNIKKLTKKPFGCNLITPVPYSGQLLNIILDEHVPVVELEGSIEDYKRIADYAKKIKAESIPIIGKAASVEEAKMLEEAGVDMVSVKGADGGGHIYGFTGTFSLIPQVVDTVNIPVINSSGVADGRGVAASFMLGAAGVEVGSRFLLAYECNVHKKYKLAVLNAKEGDTVLTGVTVHDAVRGVRNQLTDKILNIEKIYDGEETVSRLKDLCSGSLRKAAQEGNTDTEGTVLVGQNVGLLNKEESVKEIMLSLTKDITGIIDFANTLH